MEDQISQKKNHPTSEFATILRTRSVEFLLSRHETVPVSSLRTKGTFLFFSANWCRPCRKFVPQLTKIYDSLSAEGIEFEIVFISLDRDQVGFEDHFNCMPWLAVPFDEEGLHRKIIDAYHVHRIPMLVPLNFNKEVAEDLVALIEDYGSDAYPFTSSRRDELRAIDDGKRHESRLEDLSSTGNYLVSREGEKTLISDLEGKVIGLFFGAHWSPPCRAFASQLIEAHNELKSINCNQFEVILVSTDRDQGEFELDLNTIPWPAIPYEDSKKHDLCRIFRIKSIPALVIIGDDGRTVTTEGKDMISNYGASAFPFTNSRISELKSELKKKGEELPQKVTDTKHPHELKLDMATAYVCDFCNAKGRFWTFTCTECDYDLHPDCVEQTRSVL